MKGEPMLFTLGCVQTMLGTLLGVMAMYDAIALSDVPTLWLIIIAISGLACSWVGIINIKNEL